MSDPALGLTMLALIVVVIMMGFPTAFTLMGLGMFFGFIAFYDPTQHFTDNKVFDLMVQRAYGAMTNDVLISIPLFVLMGYVMERGALVDKMFYSIHLAFRHVPASLPPATLIAPPPSRTAPPPPPPPAPPLAPTPPNPPPTAGPHVHP